MAGLKASLNKDDEQKSVTTVSGGYTPPAPGKPSTDSLSIGKDYGSGTVDTTSSYTGSSKIDIGINPTDFGFGDLGGVHAEIGSSDYYNDSSDYYESSKSSNPFDIDLNKGKDATVTGGVHDELTSDTSESKEEETPTEAETKEPVSTPETQKATGETPTDVFSTGNGEEGKSDNVMENGPMDVHGYDQLVALEGLSDDVKTTGFTEEQKAKYEEEKAKTEEQAEHIATYDPNKPREFTASYDPNEWKYETGESYTTTLEDGTVRREYTGDEDDGRDCLQVWQDAMDPTIDDAINFLVGVTDDNGYTSEYRTPEEREAIIRQYANVISDMQDFLKNWDDASMDGAREAGYTKEDFETILNGDKEEGILGLQTIWNELINYENSMRKYDDLSSVDVDKAYNDAIAPAEEAVKAADEALRAYQEERLNNSGYEDTEWAKAEADAKEAEYQKAYDEAVKERDEIKGQYEADKKHIEQQNNQHRIERAYLGNQSMEDWQDSKERLVMALGQSKPIDAEPYYGEGNIDLNARPVLINDDGTYSTVDSITYEEDGQFVLIPTVIKDGDEWKHVSEEEAIKYYKEHGEYLGKFDTQEAADDYGYQLHKDQANYYHDEAAGKMLTAAQEGYDKAQEAYSTIKADFDKELAQYQAEVARFFEIDEKLRSITNPWADINGYNALIEEMNTLSESIAAFEDGSVEKAKAVDKAREERDAAGSELKSATRKWGEFEGEQADTAYLQQALDYVNDKIARLEADDLTNEELNCQIIDMNSRSQGGDIIYGDGNINLPERVVSIGVESGLGDEDVADAFESMAIQINGEGDWILIPRMAQDENGEWDYMSQVDARKHFNETGEYFGKYATAEEAARAQRQLQSQEFTDSALYSYWENKATEATAAYSDVLLGLGQNITDKTAELNQLVLDGHADSQEYEILEAEIKTLESQKNQIESELVEYRENAEKYKGALNGRSRESTLTAEEEQKLKVFKEVLEDRNKVDYYMTSGIKEYLAGDTTGHALEALISQTKAEIGFTMEERQAAFDAYAEEWKAAHGVKEGQHGFEDQLSYDFAHDHPEYNDRGLTGQREIALGKYILENAETMVPEGKARDQIIDYAKFLLGNERDPGKNIEKGKAVQDIGSEMFGTRQGTFLAEMEQAFDEAHPEYQKAIDDREELLEYQKDFRGVTFNLNWDNPYAAPAMGSDISRDQLYDKKVDAGMDFVDLAKGVQLIAQGDMIYTDEEHAGKYEQNFRALLDGFTDLTAEQRKELFDYGYKYGFDKVLPNDTWAYDELKTFAYYIGDGNIGTAFEYAKDQNRKYDGKTRTERENAVKDFTEQMVKWATGEFSDKERNRGLKQIAGAGFMVGASVVTGIPTAFGGGIVDAIRMGGDAARTGEVPVYATPSLTEYASIINQTIAQELNEKYGTYTLNAGAFDLTLGWGDAYNMVQSSVQSALTVKGAGRLFGTGLAGMIPGLDAGGMAKAVELASSAYTNLAFGSASFTEVLPEAFGRTGDMNTAITEAFVSGAADGAFETLSLDIVLGDAMETADFITRTVLSGFVEMSEEINTEAFKQAVTQFLEGNKGQWARDVNALVTDFGYTREQAELEVKRKMHNDLVEAGKGGLFSGILMGATESAKSAINDKRDENRGNTLINNDAAVPFVNSTLERLDDPVMMAASAKTEVPTAADRKSGDTYQAAKTDADTTTEDKAETPTEDKSATPAEEKKEPTKISPAANVNKPGSQGKTNGAKTESDSATGGSDVSYNGTAKEAEAPAAPATEGKRNTHGEENAEKRNEPNAPIVRTNEDQRVEEILKKGTATSNECREIAKDQALRDAFEKLTGIKLKGSRSQIAAQVRAAASATRANAMGQSRTEAENQSRTEAAKDKAQTDGKNRTEAEQKNQAEAAAKKADADGRSRTAEEQKKQAEGAKNKAEEDGKKRTKSEQLRAELEQAQKEQEQAEREAEEAKKRLEEYDGNDNEKRRALQEALDAKKKAANEARIAAKEAKAAEYLASYMDSMTPEAEAKTETEIENQTPESETIKGGEVATEIKDLAESIRDRWNERTQAVADTGAKLQAEIDEIDGRIKAGTATKNDMAKLKYLTNQQAQNVMKTKDIARDIGKLMGLVHQYDPKMFNAIVLENSDTMSKPALSGIYLRALNDTMSEIMGNTNSMAYLYAKNKHPDDIVLSDIGAELQSKYGVSAEEASKVQLFLGNVLNGSATVTLPAIRQFVNSDMMKNAKTRDAVIDFIRNAVKDVSPELSRVISSGTSFDIIGNTWGFFRIADYNQYAKERREYDFTAANTQEGNGQGRYITQPQTQTGPTPIPSKASMDSLNQLMQARQASLTGAGFRSGGTNPNFRMAIPKASDTSMPGGKTENRKPTAAMPSATPIPAAQRTATYTAALPSSVKEVAGRQVRVGRTSYNVYSYYNMRHAQNPNVTLDIAAKEFRMLLQGASMQAAIATVSKQEGVDTKPQPTEKEKKKAEKEKAKADKKAGKEKGTENKGAEKSESKTEQKPEQGTPAKSNQDKFRYSPDTPWITRAEFIKEHKEKNGWTTEQANEGFDTIMRRFASGAFPAGEAVYANAAQSTPTNTESKGNEKGKSKTKTPLTVQEEALQQRINDLQRQYDTLYNYGNAMRMAGGNAYQKYVTKLNEIKQQLAEAKNDLKTLGKRNGGKDYGALLGGTSQRGGSVNGRRGNGTVQEGRTQSNEESGKGARVHAQSGSVLGGKIQYQYGQVVFDTDNKKQRNKKLTSQERAVLRQANQSGVERVLFISAEDMTVDGESVRGYFDVIDDKRTVIVNVNGDLAHGVHEVVHSMLNGMDDVSLGQFLESAMAEIFKGHEADFERLYKYYDIAHEDIYNKKHTNKDRYRRLVLEEMYADAYAGIDRAVVWGDKSFVSSYLDELKTRAAEVMENTKLREWAVSDRQTEFSKFSTEYYDEEVLDPVSGSRVTRREFIDRVTHGIDGFDGIQKITPMTPEQAEKLFEEYRRDNEQSEEIGGMYSLAEAKTVEAGDTEVDIDPETNSAAPEDRRLSRATWNLSDYVTSKERATNELASALGVPVAVAEKYIDDINSIAKMIADDPTRLDYDDTGLSPFVSNAEYGGSFDFTTLCKKRRLLTGTFSAIQQALPNTALTAQDILKIRAMMDAANLEVNCGKCYVEGSRAQMGVFTKRFLELYQQYNPGAWVPNMAEMNTPDGIEWVRQNHPEVYEQYEYFWNHYGTLRKGDKNLFASQQKPKLYQMRSAYKGEIMKHFKDAADIEQKNRNGGVRLQSFSDFEIVHLLDAMQVITDMSRVGLQGQAYTKVPDFAWALGDTGLKINLSIDAWSVDENGRLVFNNKEGMNFDTAMELRDAYSKNVGTICCVYDDQQLLAALADDRIDFIIPFHRSQWKKSQYKAMGLPATTKDYTNQQNEKWLNPKEHTHEYKGRQVPTKCTNYMPNEYWDFSKSGKENAEAYLQMCAEEGKRPKFYKFLVNNGDGSYSLQPDGSTDGYWKLLIDFKMYDNDGNGSPQLPVTPNFNMEQANRMLREYEGGQNTFPVAHGIVDQFVKEYKEEHPGVGRFSLVGRAENGMEIYETSEETKKLSTDERVEQFKNLMENEYRGRTARFVRNGHTYYAKFDTAGVNKNVYGDDKSTPAGWRAKIRAGADGDIFDLIENSEYDRSGTENQNKKGRAHTNASQRWDYFIKKVQIDGRVYDLTANVRRSGEDFVYNVVLKQDNKTKAATSYSPVQRPDVRFDIAVNDIKPQNGENVKPDYSKVTGNTEMAEALRRAAAKQNGRTSLAARGFVLNENEINAIQGIGKKSVNDFTDADLKASEKLANQHWKNLGVKSPFFRAWFGDWRENDKTPVHVATKKGETRGVHINADTGWEINISRKVYYETLEHNLSSSNKAAQPYLSYIDDIVESAVLLNSEGLKNSKSANSLLMHSLYAVADIGNGPEVIKLYVEEMNDPNKDDTTKRAYQLQNIEKYRTARKSSQQAASFGSAQSSSISTIADLFKYVKRVDPDFNPSPASKVVDDDGNPLVVYHGTEADFTIFDRTKSRSTMDIQGNFFSPWFEDAEGYGSKVGAYYLNIKNPAPEGIGYRALNMFKGQNDAGVKARQYLESLGYDGVNNGNEEYIAFNPEQIKSVENIGTFNKSNPDYRFSASNRSLSEEAIDAWLEELKDYDIADIDRYFEREFGPFDMPTQTDEFESTEEEDTRPPLEERRPSRNVENGEYNHTAYVKPETLNAWLSGVGYAAPGHPTYSKAYVGWMNPDDFLYLTTDNYDEEDHIRQRGWYSDLNEISDRARNIHPIYLRIDQYTGKVWGHEGRHRMQYLQQLGIDKVPVVFLDEGEGAKYDKELRNGITLTGQTDDRKTVDLDTPLIPLHARYKADLEAEFVNGEGEDSSKPTARFSAAARPETIAEVEEDAEYEADTARYSLWKGPEPRRTQYGFKLMNVDENGLPHAMFIDAAAPYELGVWYAADSPKMENLISLEPGYAYLVDENDVADIDSRKPVTKKDGSFKGLPAKSAINQATKEGKRWMVVDQYADGSKSIHNVGINGSGGVSTFALRPGIHAVDIPSMKHIGAKSEGAAKIDTRRPDQRWFLIEYPVDVDYNQEAYQHETKDIREHLPERGWYSFQTNSGAEAKQHWFITGGMKIVGAVSEEDVRRYAREHGFVEDLPWKMGKNYSEDDAIDLDEYIRTTSAKPTPSKEEMRKQIELAIETGTTFDQYGDEVTLPDYNPSVTQSDLSEKLYYSTDGNTAYYKTDSGETVVINNIGTDSPEAKYINYLEAQNNADRTDNTTTKPYTIPPATRNANDGYNLGEPDAGLRRGTQEVLAENQEGTLRSAGSNGELYEEGGPESSQPESLNRRYSFIFGKDEMNNKGDRNFKVYDENGNVATTFDTYPVDSFEQHILLNLRDGNMFDLEEMINDFVEAHGKINQQSFDNLKQIIELNDDLTEEKKQALYEAIKKAVKKYGAIQHGGGDKKPGVILPKKMVDAQGNERNTRKHIRTTAANVGNDHLTDRMLYEGMTNELLGYNPQSNAESIRKAWNIINNSFGGDLDKAAEHFGSMVRAGELPRAEDIAMAELIITEYSNDPTSFDKAVKLAADVSIMGTNLGQAMQAMAIIKKATPQGQLYYLNGVVRFLNNMYDKRIKDHKMDRIVIDQDLAEQLMMASTRADIDNAVEAIKDNIAEQIPATIMDKWNAWRYLAMLGNPRTHIRNIFGNALFMPAVFMKDMIARRLEQIPGLVAPENRLHTPGADLSGWLLNSGSNPYIQFAYRDYNTMKDVVGGKKAGSKFSDANDILNRRRIFKNEFLHKYEKGNTAALETEDLKFQQRYYVRYLAEALQAKGITPEELAAFESSDPQENVITPEKRAALNQARHYATQQAQRDTYHEMNTFSMALNRMKASGPVANVLLEGLMPFVGTPTNIFALGAVKYTPINLVRSMVQLKNELKNGGENTMQIIDDMAAGLTGTGVMVLGALLAAGGLLRGAGPSDDDEAKLEKLQGHQSWAIEFPWFGGKRASYTIDWMAPMAMPLFMGSTIYELCSHQMDLSDPSALWQMLMGLADPMLSMSMLDGLESTLSSISYSRGENSLSTLLAAMITSYFAQGMPTIGGQLARTLDPTRRATYVDKNSKIPGAMQRFIQNSIQSKIPGVLEFFGGPDIPLTAENKMAYVDAWGRTDTNDNILLRALENFLSPGYASLINETPVDEEIMRLYEAVGKDVKLPSELTKSFKIDGEEKNLTAAEFEQLMKVAGSTAYDIIFNMITDARYEAMTDPEKAEAVNKAFDFSTTYARHDVEDAYALASWMNTASMVGPADYILTKGQLPETYTNDQMFALLASSPYLDSSQIADMVSAEYTPPSRTLYSEANTGYVYDITDEDRAAMRDIFNEEIHKEVDILKNDPEYINGDEDTRAEKLEYAYGRARDNTKARYVEILDGTNRPTKIGKASAVSSEKWGVAINMNDDVHAQANYLAESYSSGKEIKNPDHAGYIIDLDDEQKGDLKEKFAAQWDKDYQACINSEEYLEADEDKREGLVAAAFNKTADAVEAEFAKELYASGKATEHFDRAHAGDKWAYSYQLAVDNFKTIEEQAEWLAGKLTGTSSVSNPDQVGHKMKLNKAQKEEEARREQERFIDVYTQLVSKKEFQDLPFEMKVAAIEDLEKAVVAQEEAAYAKYILEKGYDYEDVRNVKSSRNDEFFTMLFNDGLTRNEQFELLKERYNSKVGSSKVKNNSLTEVQQAYRVDKYMEYMEARFDQFVGPYMTSEQEVAAIDRLAANFEASMHGGAMKTSAKQTQQQYGIYTYATDEQNRANKANPNWRFGWLSQPIDFNRNLGGYVIPPNMTLEGDRADEEDKYEYEE